MKREGLGWQKKLIKRTDYKMGGGGPSTKVSIAQGAGNGPVKSGKNLREYSWENIYTVQGGGFSVLGNR